MIVTKSPANQKRYIILGGFYIGLMIGAGVYLLFEHFILFGDGPIFVKQLLKYSAAALAFSFVIYACGSCS